MDSFETSTRVRTTRTALLLHPGVVSPGSEGADAVRDRDAVLRTFVTPGGRLSAIPTRVRKRLVVLDYLAQQFPIGEVITETEVNDRLRAFHDDVAALRRYLLEEEFLERRDGEYWRCGGTVGHRGALHPAADARPVGDPSV